MVTLACSTATAIDLGAAMRRIIDDEAGGLEAPQVAVGERRLDIIGEALLHAAAASERDDRADRAKHDNDNEREHPGHPTTLSGTRAPCGVSVPERPVAVGAPGHLAATISRSSQLDHDANLDLDGSAPQEPRMSSLTLAQEHHRSQ